MEFPRECVVLDTETTGTPPGGRIVELGAIKVRGRNVVERFESLLFPERPIPEAAAAFHGITDAAVADAPTAAEILPGFLEWTEGLPLVAHNAAFDACALASECARQQRRAPDNPVLCTLQGARKLLRLRSYTLENLVAELGLPSARHHRATEDAQHTLHVLWRLRATAPVEPPRGLLGPGRPLSSFAPDPPRLPESRRFLLAAAQRGEAVDLVYVLPDHRTLQVRTTPRFFFRSRGGTVMEGLCHEDLHLKNYRLERVLQARLQPDAPPVEVRRAQRTVPPAGR